MPYKLFLTLAYDGSHFCGYQVQSNAYTVQQALNEATEAVFGQRCDITGCSRTDSGVHARMFCATVTSHGEESFIPAEDRRIPIDKLPRLLNARLPDAAAILRAQRVPLDFHARYSVTSKEYIYEIACRRHASDAPDGVRDPFSAGRAWQYPRVVDDAALARMQIAARAFAGKQDFRACMASGSNVQSTVRHVFSSAVTREGGRILFRVRADGFLYNMVRIMAGTLAEVAEGLIPAEEIPARLASGNRACMGRTAPAEGLYLNRVFYDSPDTPGYNGADVEETFPLTENQQTGGDFA